MTISKDLFLAILSMDSYNQGYGAGVNGVGTQIGNAAVKDVALPDNFAADSQAAGFYAVAYQLADGSIVISYRGTDANVVSPFNPVGSDLSNGYGLALGDYSAPQAELAAQFYQAVKQANPAANIIL